MITNNFFIIVIDFLIEHCKSRESQLNNQIIFVSLYEMCLLVYEMNVTMLVIAYFQQVA